jgi:hypothetical protein
MYRTVYRTGSLLVPFKAWEKWDARWGAGRGPTIDSDGYSAACGRVSVGCTLGGTTSLILDGGNLAAELLWREVIPSPCGDRDETGEAMTEASERRADTTRQRLIAAAARQFARRSYSMVSPMTS